MEDREIIKLLEKIVGPYAQNKEGLETISDNTSFIQDLEVNSANLVDIILDVEDEFDIEIDNESMQEMLTVGDAKNIIRKKIAQK